MTLAWAHHKEAVETKIAKLGHRGACLARSEEGAYLVVRDRRATMPGGIDRRSRWQDYSDRPPTPDGQLTRLLVVTLCLVATFASLRCSDPCSVDHPLVRGRPFTGVDATQFTTIISSWDASLIGDQFTNQALFRSDEVNGGFIVKAEFRYSGLPECGSFYFVGTLPLDGRTFTGWCELSDSSPAAASLTLRFEEEPDSGGNEFYALGAEGRLIGEYRHATEHYRVVFDYFFATEGGYYCNEE